MTDNKTKITPPPHLMLRWQEEARDEVRDVANHFDKQSIQMIKAANWGWRQRDANVPHELQKARNQELEACCEWMHNAPFGMSLNTSSNQLRAARRPKPPSLKERIATAIAHGDNSIALVLLDQALPD